MIKIGPAGTSGLGYTKALEKCHELGLSALECAFTYSVHMDNKKAKRVGKLAQNLGISLSVHAPYWINLNSKEPKKVVQSQKRILKSCERAHHMKATHVVFHAGFYQGSSPEKTYEKIKKSVVEMKKILKENNWKTSLAPEISGKKSQFGSVEELLKLKKETRCSFCIDFAHLEARNQRVDYDEVFKKLRKVKNIHSHFSGIEYTDKGEKKHILTPDFKIHELLTYIKKYKKDVTIINESPNPFKDALKTKQILKQLNEKDNT